MPLLLRRDGRWRQEARSQPGEHKGQNNKTEGEDRHSNVSSDCHRHVRAHTCSLLMYFKDFCVYLICTVIACMHVCMCILCVQEPTEARRENWMPWNMN